MRVLLSQPWPWYVTGPLMGAVALALLLYRGRTLGVSASYRTLCAAVAPARVEFFRFDWRRLGGWNLAFACGLALGGWVGVHLLGAAEPVRLSAAARDDLAALGITDFAGLLPRELFSWRWVLSPRGLLSFGLGGFLVGFGASWAGGCTSGHGISGLADLQAPSLVAVIAFLVGGFAAAHFIMPFVI